MRDAVLVPNLVLAAPRAARRTFHAIRRPEWVVIAFLVYAAVAGCLLPVAPQVMLRVVLVNLAVGMIYWLLISSDSRRPRLALSVARDWVPLAIILLAYREMGWFALPHQDHLLALWTPDFFQRVTPQNQAGQSERGGQM